VATRDQVEQVLARYRRVIAPVLPFDLSVGDPVVFDFSAANRELDHLPLNDVAELTEYLFERIIDAEIPVGLGRYDEDRVLYRHSPLFDGDTERRSIHLGVDLFVPGGTPVASPLDAFVHSFADNDRLGDYGPTVILEHALDEVIFYTLYGHLSRESLEPLDEGLEFAAGEPIGFVGEHHENGGWPPHLHFQIITDLLGNRGDFPGVAAPSQRERWLELCPDPNLILGVGRHNPH
jgi:murein DD-endopeptidase MepM/ murein hydrolase activator NlpD